MHAHRGVIGIGIDIGDECFDFGAFCRQKCQHRNGTGTHLQMIQKTAFLEAELGGGETIFIIIQVKHAIGPSTALIAHSWPGT